MQETVLLLPKFRGEAFALFQAVAVKLHSNMSNFLFGLPGKIFCEKIA
jgi:hypothetical protein